MTQILFKAAALRSLLFVFLTLLTATASAAQDRFSQGATALFAGHSFFAPIAKEFDGLAKLAGLTNHRAIIVFQGGRKGAPGPLWNNTEQRAKIEKMLASGKIEIFALPGMGSRTSFEDFANWVDLALSYNRDTVFFLPQIYVAGGPRTETRRLGRNTAGSGNELSQTVDQLRRAYPSTRFIHVNSGIIAPVMKAMFEQGELNSLSTEVSREGNALYRDQGIGHAGTMMEHVMAIYWLESLYGIRLIDERRYSSAEVERILNRTYDVLIRLQ